MKPMLPPQRPHHRGWPQRLPGATTPPQTSLWDNLAISARRYPDKPALVFFGQALHYAQLAAQAEQLAARLHALGVQRGDRVLVVMQNCPQLVVVPINPTNRAAELAHCIADTGARVALASSDVAAELVQADA